MENQEEGARKDELERTRQVLDANQMQAEEQLAQVVAAETDAQAHCADCVRVELDCLEEQEEEQHTAQK